MATNSPEIDVAVKNIESSTATLKKLLDGVQAARVWPGICLKMSK